MLFHGNLRNETPHNVTLLRARDVFGTREHHVERSDTVVRASVEVRRIVGHVSLHGVPIPIKELEFGEPTEPVPRLPFNTVGIASLDALRAIHRQNGRVRGHMYPYGIARDGTGAIVGARGLGVPHPSTTRLPVQELLPRDVEELLPVEEWEDANSCKYPVHLYPDPNNTDEFVEDELLIDPDELEPIFTFDRAKDPADLIRGRRLKILQTLRLRTPVYETWPKDVENFPELSQDQLQVVQPEDYRGAAKLGRKFGGMGVEQMVVLGGLVRDQNTGGILGGRWFVQGSKRMLESDPF